MGAQPVSKDPLQPHLSRGVEINLGLLVCAALPARPLGCPCPRRPADRKGRLDVGPDDPPPERHERHRDQLEVRETHRNTDDRQAQRNTGRDVSEH